MNENECWWPECGGADDAPCPECPTPRLDQKAPDPDRMCALLMQEERHRRSCLGCGSFYFGGVSCPECGEVGEPLERPAVGVSP